jgi:hypothetical protein
MPPSASGVSARDKERSLRSRANTVKAYNKIPYLFGAMILIMLFLRHRHPLHGHQYTAQFMQGFWFVFLLAIIAEIIGNNATMREYGFGAIDLGHRPRAEC